MTSPLTGRGQTGKNVTGHRTRWMATSYPVMKVVGRRRFRRGGACGDFGQDVVPRRKELSAFYGEGDFEEEILCSE
ncbi:hypothetical protein CEXT_329291 [Caerostris extrusa]|uniref:Uncharacterized protein n=1 Tax=Caerostris extrusa TaxID=172846 RepID=A0AAV4Y6H0_CAEEX|nr:hypothetical protein CEXT_329291 [Caerostris extrusa]